MEKFIYSYIYSDGKLHKNDIFECELGEEHTYEIQERISSVKRYVDFLIDDRTVYMYETPGKHWFHIKLTAYFGGNSVAPHKMKIIKTK